MLVRCESLEPPMSQMGQNPNPPFGALCQLPPAADIRPNGAYARPRRTIRGCALSRVRFTSKTVWAVEAPVISCHTAKVLLFI